MPCETIQQTLEVRSTNQTTNKKTDTGDVPNSGAWFGGIFESPFSKSRTNRL